MGWSGRKIGYQVSNRRNTCRPDMVAGLVEQRTTRPGLGAGTTRSLYLTLSWRRGPLSPGARGWTRQDRPGPGRARQGGICGGARAFPRTQDETEPSKRTSPSTRAAPLAAAWPRHRSRGSGTGMTRGAVAGPSSAVVCVGSGTEGFGLLVCCPGKAILPLSLSLSALGPAGGGGVYLSASDQPSSLGGSLVSS